MVKRYHGSFPSFSYEFDSRYPLHDRIPFENVYGPYTAESGSVPFGWIWIGVKTISTEILSYDVTIGVWPLAFGPVGSLGDNNGFTFSYSARP